MKYALNYKHQLNTVEEAFWELLLYILWRLKFNSVWKHDNNYSKLN